MEARSQVGMGTFVRSVSIYLHTRVSYSRGVDVWGRNYSRVQARDRLHG